MLVEPGDVMGLTEAMTRMLEGEELRRTQGVAARKHVLSKFAIPAMVEGNQRVYEELSVCSVT